MNLQKFISQIQVLIHVVLKRTSCKWCLLLSMHCCKRFLKFRLILSSISCHMKATFKRLHPLRLIVMLKDFGYFLCKYPNSIIRVLERRPSYKDGNGVLCEEYDEPNNSNGQGQLKNRTSDNIDILTV